MKPIFLIAGLLACFASGAHAAPSEVFASGNIPEAVVKSLNQKTEFSFARLPTGEFSKPAVTQYAQLVPPESIRSERTDHDAEVGVIVSDKGKVVATCIVASNCPNLEKAAQRCAAAHKFRPASLNGKPIYFYLILPLSYKYVDPAELLKK